MATFRQRGPYQWQARIQKQGYEGQTRTFLTKEEAEVWAAEIELSMKKSEFQCQKEARATSLAKALERYRDEVSPRKKGHVEERNKINQL
ncbi:MAG: site-specific integrase, partial [Gammaproteobacteria bacterium]|nr:site-specific integrase [Gammaproteobacteria bacterium]